MMENIYPIISSLESMPYPPETFDFIFCYSVIYQTNMLKSLNEFYRVLKPGGHIYLAANAFGYHVQRWIEANKYRRAPGEMPRMEVAKSLLYTASVQETGKCDMEPLWVVEPEEMREILVKSSFIDVRIAPEGNLAVSEHFEPRPFYPPEYLGLPCCYDVLASKK
jgi:SAM-dependent methyltransferase